MVEERGSSRGNREDRGSSRGSSWSSNEDRGSSHGGKGMGTSTPKARLQRVPAKKNREYQPDFNSIDYDEENFHSSRSPGRSPLARDSKKFGRQESFRVGGDVEDIQKLMEFLGVGSPAGLGIEASDWEARKSLINSRPQSPRSMAVDSGQTSEHEDSSEFKGFQPSFDSSAGSLPSSPRLSPRLSPVANPASPIEREWKAHREKTMKSRDSSPFQQSPPPRTEFPPPGVFPILTRSGHSIDKSTVPPFSAMNQERSVLNRWRSEPPSMLEPTSLLVRADFPEAHSAPKDGAAGKAVELESPEPARRRSFSGDSADLPSAALAMPIVGRRSCVAKDSHRSKTGSLRWKSSSHEPEAESLANAVEEPPTVSEAVDSEDSGTPEKPSIVERAAETSALISSGSSLESIPGVVPKNPSWTSWAKGELLGSGTFGTVYEGVGNNGAFFAVKEVSLSDQGRSGTQAIRQLEQEIALLSEIQHPNIVQYLGTERDEDKLYIFLELVSKGSLAHVYNKYDFFYEQVRAYTKQILSGLKYLHDRKIIHRDIKCANILVDASGVVKLADFGMAKQTDKLGLLKSFMGSAHWMAPEVVNPKRSYNLMADIWSLGCTVLEMAIGKPPFGDLEAHGVLWKVGHGEGPPIPEELEDDLKSFISNCLEVNVALRPTCDLLMTHPFITGAPMSGSVKLVSAPELSSIAEERSIDMSSNTSTTSNMDVAVRPPTITASNMDVAVSPPTITNIVTNLQMNRGPRSMRTRRSGFSMSSSSESITL